MHRIVIDGTRVSAVGGRGVQVVAVTTPKGYRRREPGRAVPSGDLGMMAEQLAAGSIVNGRRVVGMTIGMTGTGVRTRRVQLDDGTWTGWLADGVRVPGTRKRTNFAAGPVGAGRGKKATKVAWNEGESGTDRNARRIDAIIYG